MAKKKPVKPKGKAPKLSRVRSMNQKELARHLIALDKRFGEIEERFKVMAGERERGGLPEFFRELDVARARVVRMLREELRASADGKVLVFE